LLKYNARNNNKKRIGRTLSANDCTD